MSSANDRISNSDYWRALAAMSAVDSIPTRREVPSGTIYLAAFAEHLGWPHGRARAFVREACRRGDVVTTDTGRKKGGSRIHTVYSISNHGKAHLASRCARELHEVNMTTDSLGETPIRQKLQEDIVHWRQVKERAEKMIEEATNSVRIAAVALRALEAAQQEIEECGGGDVWPISPDLTERLESQLTETKAGERGMPLGEVIDEIPPLEDEL